MQRSYLFDGKMFSSKSSIDKYIKEIKSKIINLNGFKPITSENISYNFLYSVVDESVSKIEKIGKGIKYFYFVVDVFNNYQLRIMRVDDTDIDISMIYSKITQTDKNVIHRRLLNDAMRYSIYNDTQAFKESCSKYTFEKSITKGGFTGAKPQYFTCKICKKECIGKEINIDHVYPFSRIRDKFLGGKTNIPIVFDDDFNSFRTMFLDTDSEFVNEWKKYHFENATFQILCRKCNITKGAKL